MRVRLETIGQLKNLLKDLDDDLQLGVYHANWWNPTFSNQSVEFEIIKENGKEIGLATEIDYRHDY